MKRTLNNLFFNLTFVLILLFSAQTLFAQFIYKDPNQIPLIEEITPQYRNGLHQQTFVLTVEMEDILDYSRQINDPLIRNYSTDKFLDRYYPNYEQSLMKNGDIAYLKFYYQKFLNTLEECQVLAKEQDLVFGTSRNMFFKKSTLETRKEKRIFWRKFYKKRNDLIDQYVKYQSYLVPAISTEIAIILQKKHLPELAAAMNQLENFDGSPLETYIYSNYLLTIPASKKRAIAGLSIISKCQDSFTSGSPAVRKTYPGLRGNNRGLSVHLRMFENGVTLSHELGHLYYLAQRWEEYVAYIRRKGKEYEPGGHGEGDPSGYAASLTEKGIMPF